MEPYVIGLDLGTGSAKAVAMNHAGRVIDTAQASYPTLQPKRGYHEQDPELIWQAFVACLARIISARKCNPDAVALSSAMHSIIPVDARGKPLMNAIIWADSRSASIATDVHRSAAGQLLYEQTGTPLHAMSPLCKIKWIKENQPEVFSQAAKFISIKEFIWHRLFDHYETDYSIASATGLFNIENRIWNDLSLDVTSLHMEQLSTPVNTNYKRTYSHTVRWPEPVLPEGIPFLIGASDGCLANVGSFATEEGTMALTIGTSGAVRIVKKKPMLNFKAMTFNYLLDDATYVCGGPTNNGGVVLKWYAETFLGKKLKSAADYDALLNTLGDTKAGAEGLVFLPYVLGERAPIWSSGACGVFFGLRADHRQAHMTRAVVEGISMALYHIADNMMDAGLDVRQIHVSGGFVHSTQWLQVIANLFGKKMLLVNTADASAVGAAMLALKDLGIISDYAELQPSDIKALLPEDQEMAAHQECFALYKELYNATAGLMADRNLTLT